ncbi:hypothetical protein D3C79_564180 [compost metagenome]
MVGQQIQMLADDQAGFRQIGRVFGVLGKLDQQAITQIARRDADRIKTLYALQYRFDLVHRHIIVTHTLQNVFQRYGEIAGVIDGIDDRSGDGGIGVRERRQIHLPHQVVLQRLRGFALVDRQFIIAIVGTGAGRGTRGIDLIPGSIQRQLFGHVLLFQRFAGV